MKHECMGIGRCEYCGRFVKVNTSREKLSSVEIIDRLERWLKMMVDRIEYLEWELEFERKWQKIEWRG